MAPSDEFDFYPCLVDAAPASIYVNLYFEHAGHAPGDDTRYTIAIGMRERGEHGIGTAAEAASLNLVEEAVIARAGELAVTYVGRVRTRGSWEIVLYGPAGHLEGLRTKAVEHAGDRQLVARQTGDATWAYYRELLVPDAERRQWMDDRRMVQILSEQGDRRITPRRVDHRIALPTVAAREAFVAAATAAAFTPDGTETLADADLPHRVRVHRVDPIELDHIHEVVMILVDAATPLGGRYDRWEAGIVT